MAKQPNANGVWGKIRPQTPYHHTASDLSFRPEQDSETPKTNMGAKTYSDSR